MHGARRPVRSDRHCDLDREHAACRLKHEFRPRGSEHSDHILVSTLNSLKERRSWGGAGRTLKSTAGIGVRVEEQTADLGTAVVRGVQERCEPAIRLLVGVCDLLEKKAHEIGLCAVATDARKRGERPFIAYTCASGRLGVAGASA